jgi:hypothetical protein
MSSEHMRTLIEAVNNPQKLSEGYMDRVTAMVSQIAKDNPDGITRRSFEQAFKRAASVLNPLEMRGSEIAQRDFKKDVLGRIELRRDTSGADAKRERTNQVLDRLAGIIQTATANSFPDGDPFDEIYPKARRLGVPDLDVLDWLDRAVKRGGMGKGYHDYLANIWDDNIGHMNGNPWR